MNRFFDRYQESLLGGENCEASEKEILTLLDMERIPCVVLASSTTRGLYEIRETADMSPLRLYLSPDGYSLVKGFLVDLGYETIRNYPECGERMRRMSGFSVDIYHKLPFKTKFYEKGMRALTIRARIRKGGEAVRILSTEDRLVFRLASVSYQYVTDELLIRDMLDLFLYHKAWRREINGAYVKKKLQEFRVDGLAEKLLRLSYMWFGAKEDKEYMQSSGQPEELHSFDILESRIFSRGEFGKDKEMDPQAQALDRMLVKEDEREAKKIRNREFKKKAAEKREAAGRHFHWIFPDYKYMSELYPNLEKMPLLLPFYWLARGFRMLIRSDKRGGQQL